MICFVSNPDFTKSSVCSLLSTAIAITVNSNRQKINVTKNFLSIYQSIFLIMPGEVNVFWRNEMIRLGRWSRRTRWIHDGHGGKVQVASLRSQGARGSRFFVARGLFFSPLCFALCPSCALRVLRDHLFTIFFLI